MKDWAEKFMITGVCPVGQAAAKAFNGSEIVFDQGDAGFDPANEKSRNTFCRDSSKKRKSRGQNIPYKAFKSQRE
jgi:hypothetical protein